ncbi:MAG TPA: cytochrome c maturation protein CcmE [Candidatus Binatia bacterium]|nr:cytochrome c maturation protein CcmE [Candidatus Binatia bacterium]
MTRKTKFAIGSAIIAIAVAALVYTAVRETSAYFLTMDEYARDPAALAGQPLRLAGRVSTGTVKWDPRTLDLEFLLQPIPPGEGGTHEARRVAAPDPALASATLPVRYNGILPDMFADGRDVIVEGRVDGGVFHAKALLTTCPSKYEADVEGADAGAARDAARPG